ncbi:unknown [Acetobacter sp. CAG:267]|nr:unknown [Acetobacter sp. CAG:267]
MKNLLENFFASISQSQYSLYICIFLWSLFICLYFFVFDTPQTFFSIFINPVFLFGAPYLILDYLRYKELKKTYKNYTLEDFIYAYENAPALAHAKPNNFKSKFRPLARNILSLSRYYTDTENLKNKEITVDEFIKQKYRSKFKFDYLFPTESGVFYYMLFLGICIQLELWGIIKTEQ